MDHEDLWGSWSAECSLPMNLHHLGKGMSRLAPNRLFWALRIQLRVWFIMVCTCSYVQDYRAKFLSRMACCDHTYTQTFMHFIEAITAQVTYSAGKTRFRELRLRKILAPSLQLRKVSHHCLQSQQGPLTPLSNLSFPQSSLIEKKHLPFLPKTEVRNTTLK